MISTACGSKWQFAGSPPATQGRATVWSQVQCSSCPVGLASKASAAQKGTSSTVHQRNPKAAISGPCKSMQTLPKQALKNKAEGSPGRAASVQPLPTGLSRQSVCASAISVRVDLMISVQLSFGFRSALFGMFELSGFMIRHSLSTVAQQRRSTRLATPAAPAPGMQWRQACTAAAQRATPNGSRRGTSERAHRDEDRASVTGR